MKVSRVPYYKTVDALVLLSLFFFVFYEVLKISKYSEVSSKLFEGINKVISSLGMPELEIFLLLNVLPKIFLLSALSLFSYYCILNGNSSPASGRKFLVIWAISSLFFSLILVVILQKKAGLDSKVVKTEFVYIGLWFLFSLLVTIRYGTPGKMHSFVVLVMLLQSLDCFVQVKMSFRTEIIVDFFIEILPCAGLFLIILLGEANGSHSIERFGKGEEFFTDDDELLHGLIPVDSFREELATSTYGTTENASKKSSRLRRGETSAVETGFYPPTDI